jgi:hypothetical protein
MSRYQPIQAVHDPINGSYVLVADKGTALADPVVSTRELGYSSPSPFTSWMREEHNPKLRDRQGLTEYYRMKRQDGTVRGALRQFKAPILGARWTVVPDGQSDRAKNIAQAVHRNLFHGLNVTWASVLEDILLMCEYGHMVIEKVWTDQAVPGMLTYQKLAPRHPLDIRDWRYDANGGPSAVVMEPNSTDPNFIESEGIPIPIRKLAIFSLEPEAGDLSGLSILRSAYKHWFYKDTFYKIDAIQKERHGIGVPIIKLPPGFGDGDKRLANELGRNLRTNERAHIVLPPGWDIMFAKLEGQPVDCLKSIDHHDKMIWMNILAPFAREAGSDVDNAEMFHRATRYVASHVVGIVNKFVIKPFVDANYARNRLYPEIRASRMGEENELRTRSFTTRNYVGSGIIVPDDALEAHIREENDLPPADPTTSRVQATPQGAPGGGGAPTPPDNPRVGPPRQVPQPPVGPGRSNTGVDRSGESTPFGS